MNKKSYGFVDRPPSPYLEVRVRDGQTLILSGVLSNTDAKTKTKFPILGNIPIIGNLFTSKSKTTDNSELVIMVTPKIINDQNVDIK